MSDWSCIRCTYTNSPTNFACEICETPNIRVVLTSWSCWRCSTSNVSSSQLCTKCGLPRTQDRQQQPPTPTHVTFRNQRSNHVTHDPRPVTGSLLLPRNQDSEFILALRAIQEHETNEQYENIVTFCRQNQQNFVDDSFPPTSASLKNRNGRRNSRPQFAEWRRAKDILSSDGSNLQWAVYRDPNPNDIQQGYLGNCWFLSALALLTDGLENIIVSKTISREGVYQVRLCIDGQWIVVIVDDYFPCDRHGRLIYSKAKRKQLWVPLIEKALAKVHGSYASLTAGTTVEGLAVLTGAPCEAIKTPGDQNAVDPVDDTEIFWATLLSCKEAGFLIGASCGKGDVEYNNEEYERIGLQSRHAYSLLDVTVIDNNRLVKLRNPWGHFEWNGPWSNGSSRWTEETRRRLMPQGRSEGIFWMPFAEFCRYFDAIDVCKLKKGSKELRLVDVLPPHCLEKLVFATHLDVPEATEVDFVLYQAKTRGDTHASKHGPMDILLIVLEKNSRGQPSKFICRTSRHISPFVSCSHVLQRGSYMILSLAFNHWGTALALDDIPRCVVALHSPKPLSATVTVVDPSNVADSLILMLLKQGRRKSDRRSVATYTMNTKWSGEIIMIENLSSSHSLCIKCDSSESENIVCSRGAAKTADVVPPMHRQIVVVLSQLEGSNGYTVKYSLWYVESRQNHLGKLANDPRSAGESHWPLITPEVKGLHQPRPIT